MPWIPNPLGQPVKRGLWTWYSPQSNLWREVCEIGTLLPRWFSPLPLDFGLSTSTIHPQSIYSLGADICVNHPQSPPSHLQDYSTCNSARWLNLFPWYDPNEWCLKNGLLSKGLNPGPLGHESSALPLDHKFPPSIHLLRF